MHNGFTALINIKGSLHRKFYLYNTTNYFLLARNYFIYPVYLLPKS
jgi:hypothetical protein